MDNAVITPGQRFLNLLRLEYETLVRIAESNIKYSDYMREHYASAFEAEDLEYMERNRIADEADLIYYKERLDQMGGAENGSTIPTEIKVSESPQQLLDPKFGCVAGF